MFDYSIIKNIEYCHLCERKLYNHNMYGKTCHYCLFPLHSAYTFASPIYNTQLCYIGLVDFQFGVCVNNKYYLFWHDNNFLNIAKFKCLNLNEKFELEFDINLLSDFSKLKLEILAKKLLNLKSFL